MTKQPLRVAAVLGDVVVDPADGLRHVADDRPHVHRRQQPVVGRDEDEALLGERLRLDLHVLLVAGLPAAAVNPEDDRQVLRPLRRVHVEHLPLVRPSRRRGCRASRPEPAPGRRRRGRRGEGDACVSSMVGSVLSAEGICHGRSMMHDGLGWLDRLAGRLQAARSWGRSGTPPRCSPACSRRAATPRPA